MDFESELEKAIQRGNSLGKAKNEADQKALNSQEQIRNRHTEFRLSLSEYIETGLNKAIAVGAVRLLVMTLIEAPTGEQARFLVEWKSRFGSRTNLTWSTLPVRERFETKRFLLGITLLTSLTPNKMTSKPPSTNGSWSTPNSSPLEQSELSL